ncbi:MAG TPA: M20/M25/M40 family metallo-hydrolase [Acidimicrobiia bacterium]
MQPFHRDDVSGYLDLGTFDNGDWGPTVYESLDGVNVVAIREGAVSAEAVLVLAHHDTICDSPGANDNTASVVALIEVARLLGDRRFKRTVILAAVDMEEIGLHGSDHLAETVRVDRDISAVIVLETMAYMSKEPGSQLLPPGLGVVYRSQVARMRANDMTGDFAAVLYRRRSSRLAATFASALQAVGGKVIMLRDPADLVGLGPVLTRTVPFVRDFARSDHKPFWERGDPAILVTDTANFRYPHYHQPTDTPDKLDYKHLADITLATVMTVERCAE